jgi:hypothetical protein
MVPDSEFTCCVCAAARVMAFSGVTPAAELEEDVVPDLADAPDEDDLAGGLLEHAVTNASVAAPMTTAAARQEPARRGSDKWIK